MLSKLKGLPVAPAVENQAQVDHGDMKEESEFNLNSFVPLSEVKHTAPPEWVSLTYWQRDFKLRTRIFSA